MLLALHAFHLLLVIILASTIFFISACSNQMNGKAKNSNKIPPPESTVTFYGGPKYTIRIAQFANMIPGIVPGAGEAATAILQAQFEKAGITTELEDKNALKEANKSKILQPSGAGETKTIDDVTGLDTPDFRLSGVISAYSELAESSDPVNTQKNSSVASISLDYAFIDITTGKPLLEESGMGEYRNTTSDSSGLRPQSSFDTKLLEGTLRDALGKVAEKVIRKLDAIPFQGNLLATDGTSLVVKAGRSSRLAVGTQLNVYRVYKVLVDPDNGQVLGYKESKIGVILINEHLSDKVSSATIVSGSGMRAGDAVKP